MGKKYSSTNELNAEMEKGWYTLSPIIFQKVINWFETGLF